jgi:hypothetical protein
MSESVDVAVAIPFGDRGALAELDGNLANGSSVVESRSLDGVTLSTAIVTLTAVSLPTLKAWMVARLDAKKGCVVSFEGVTLQGYSVGEVEKIIGILRREVEPGSDDA